jgi:hypothetical protein
MAGEFEKWLAEQKFSKPPMRYIVERMEQAFAAGARSFQERAAKKCEGMHCSANDGYGLTCHRDDAKAIRLMKTEGEK